MCAMARRMYSLSIVYKLARKRFNVEFKQMSAEGPVGGNLVQQRISKEKKSAVKMSSQDSDGQQFNKN